MHMYMFKSGILNLLRNQQKPITSNYVKSDVTCFDTPDFDMNKI